MLTLCKADVKFSRYTDHSQGHETLSDSGMEDLIQPEIDLP